MPKKDEKTIYCIRPCLKGKHSDKSNDSFAPGEEFTGSTAEASTLLASGRFVEDKEKAEEINKRNKSQKANNKESVGSLLKK